MGCRNYDICSIDFMLPSYRHHPFCLICNVLTMICKRQFINTRIFFTFTTFFFFSEMFFFTTYQVLRLNFCVFLLLLSMSFLGTFLHIIVFCSRVVVVLYLSCHSYILLLFFFPPLFFDLTLLPCFLYFFLFWKRFSDSGISFVNNVFSSSPYIRRPNGNYFLAFTVY